VLANWWAVVSPHKRAKCGPYRPTIGVLNLPEDGQREFPPFDSFIVRGQQVPACRNYAALVGIDDRICRIAFRRGKQRGSFRQGIGDQVRLSDMAYVDSGKMPTVFDAEQQFRRVGRQIVLDNGVLLIGEYPSSFGQIQFFASCRQETQGQTGIDGSGTERCSREDRCEDLRLMRTAFPFLIKLTVGAILMAAGVYGVWFGYSNRLGVVSLPATQVVKQIDGIAAIDRFVVVTAAFRLLY
jgi:hypothetical protein